MAAQSTRDRRNFITLEAQKVNARGDVPVSLVALSTTTLQNLERALRDYDHSRNALLNASSELVGLCGTLSRVADARDLNVTRAEIAQAIINLKYKVVQLDYPPSVAENLCLLFAIVIDEFILTTPWSRASGWENLTLVADLFGFRDGGDRFYNITERALMQPRALNDLLHLIYIFMKLGYCGRMPGGKERERLIHRLEAALELRETPEPNAGFGRQVTQTRPPRTGVTFWRKLFMAGFLIVFISGVMIAGRISDEKKSAQNIDVLRAQAEGARAPVYVYSSETGKTTVQDDE